MTPGGFHVVLRASMSAVNMAMLAAMKKKPKLLTARRA
jgi:hypothetical protein